MISLANSSNLLISNKFCNSLIINSGIFLLYFGSSFNLEYLLIIKISKILTKIVTFYIPANIILK